MEHPIPPPPELVSDWAHMLATDTDTYVFTQAARWGADQELEACCHLLRQQGFDVVDDLRATRRPKPPSLKEQALEALDEEHADMQIQNYKLIRSVLESLPD
jgi:hypothetical protein